MKKNDFLIMIVALLWCWSNVLALDVRPFLRGAPPTVATFTAQAASFNGSSQYIRTTSALVGVADGRRVTCSFWVNFSGGDGSTQQIFNICNSTNPRLTIQKTTANLIRVLGETSSSTDVCDFTGSTALTAAHAGWDGSDGWNHVFIVIDITSGDGPTREAATKMYINGVQETEVFTVTSNAFAIDLAPGPDPRVNIGASSTPVASFAGDLAEFVFYDTYHDSPASFYSGTKPADIGSTGATPTGSAPDIYLSRNGSGSDWATDSSGNANNFTVTGGPLGSPTAP